MRILLFALIAASLAWAAPARADEPVQLTLVAKKEVLVKSKDGKTERKLIEPKAVAPGDVIVYLLSFRNTGNKPKENVTINDPIPANTIYLAGSATGPGAEILFSVDGKHFAPEGKVTVTENGEKRLADPSEYRHIRWRLKHPLAPGKAGQASFRVKVK